MRIPVFLSTRTFRDNSGTLITIRERRLIRQTSEDRVIALVEAPDGSRVRRRRDQFGFEQLLIPLQQTLWGRLFGASVIVPAKYVIGKARHGECGLSLIPLASQEAMPRDRVESTDDLCAPLC